MKLLFPRKTQFFFFVFRRSLSLYSKAFGFDTSDVLLIEVYDIRCKFGFVLINTLFILSLLISIDSNHAHFTWLHGRTRIPLYQVSNICSCRLGNYLEMPNLFDISNYWTDLPLISTTSEETLSGHFPRGRHVSLHQRAT